MAFAWDEFGPVGSLGGPHQLACRVDPEQRQQGRESRTMQLTMHFLLKRRRNKVTQSKSRSVLSAAWQEMSKKQD